MDRKNHQSYEIEHGECITLGELFIMRDSIRPLKTNYTLMKAAIFTWLFLLPLQIYASGYDSRHSEDLTQNTHRIESSAQAIDLGSSELIASAEPADRSANFQAIAVSQEKDIQRLKSQLAHKNHEIYTQELDQWKSKTAILIFFVGMLVFALLYIRSKRTDDHQETLTYSTLYPQQK